MAGTCFMQGLVLCRVFMMGSVARTTFLKRVSMGLTFSRWAKKMTVVVIGVLVTVKRFSFNHNGKKLIVSR